MNHQIWGHELQDHNPQFGKCWSVKFTVHYSRVPESIYLLSSLQSKLLKCCLSCDVCKKKSTTMLSTMLTSIQFSMDRAMYVATHHDWYLTRFYTWHWIKNSEGYKNIHPGILCCIILWLINSSSHILSLDSMFLLPTTFVIYWVMELVNDTGIVSFIMFATKLSKCSLLNRVNELLLFLMQISVP